MMTRKQAEKHAAAMTELHGEPWIVPRSPPMTKHTPGPWHHKQAGSEIAIWADVQSDGPAKISMVIAKTFYNRGASDYTNRTNRQQQVNARLIAAAPDLLAALEDLVTRCDSDEGARADGSNIQTMRAHAILAKLEGE